MNCNDVKPGMRVKIIKLDDTQGMLIKSQHLKCRKAGIIGTIKGWVPGHGGDVWWVQHDGCDEVGAYCFTEMEAATP